MATLSSIRKHGAALVIVIGIALFAFIAGDAAKVLQPSQNSQLAGKINGKKIEAQAFQQMVEEYTQAINFIRGGNSLTEAENAQIKDEVWSTLVTNELIGEQAKKLGRVTDAQIELVNSFIADPDKFLHDFLVAHPDFLANEIAKGGKSAQRAELCIASGFAPEEALPKK